MSAIQQAYIITGKRQWEETLTGQDRESERERREGGREANEKVNSCQLCL